MTRGWTRWPEEVTQTPGKKVSYGSPARGPPPHPHRKMDRAGPGLEPEPEPLLLAQTSPGYLLLRPGAGDPVMLAPIASGWA